MFVRRTSVVRNGKRYQYSQLVESYRRPDGTPAHRVLHSFGQLSDVEHENIKLAFKASSQGKALVLPSETAARHARILDNLDYLPHAVLLELWKQWGLSPLIDQLANEDAREVAVSDVIAALVLQRCTQPESKLASVEWYQRTALPELQGCSPAAYNNTRLHRALDALFRIERPLQDALASKVVTAQGRPRLLFLDCTDTWFTSDGPPLASKRSGKDKVLRMKVGILLLCDQDGMPLRWATLAGSHHEADSMLQVARAIMRWQWARDAPLVMDRACGTNLVVAQLQAAGVRFLTAVPRAEFASYSHRIPLGAFDSIAPDLDALRQHAADLGFVRVTDDRYVLDLGVFARGERASGSDEPTLLPTLSRAAASLLFARKVAAEVEDSDDSHDEISARYGIPARTLRRFLPLVRLEKHVQQAILEGRADRLSVDKLREIEVLPPDEQLMALLRAEEASTGQRLMPTKLMAEHVGVDVLEVRGLVTFNPRMFLNQQQAAQEQQQKVTEFVADLNKRLVVSGRRRQQSSVFAEVGEYLRRHSLLSMFDIRVDKVEHKRGAIWQVALVRNETEWTKRRGTDGLNLIIAHPDLAGTAQELVAYYFAKDKVEKDFRIIKSSLELRPVHHRTDPKVQAHVSLCILGLLLERTLEKKLRDAGLKWSADKAISTLASCHLNRLATETPTYTPTVPTHDQRVLIEALGLGHLLDETAISGALTPR